LEHIVEIPETTVNFGWRGATWSGLCDYLTREGVKFTAYTIDDNGKRWDKEI
jgi:hypothetical protein